MRLSVHSLAGVAQGSAEIADDILIAGGKGTQAVHDVVVAYLANQRLGTAKTKQIGDVRGSGKKPWRQKGTGRARAGSFASPLWRGGGVVFGPQPRDYSVKIPKKIKSLAFRKALTERLRAGDVMVVEELKMTGHKTKEFAGIIQKFVGNNTTALVVIEQMETNLKLASRNLPEVQVEPADAVNVYELLRYDKILVTKAALDKLTARLQKS